MAIFAGNISGSSLTGSLSYNSLTSVPTGIVSSSTQIVAILPNGIVSSSVQVDITQTTGYNTFSSSLATVDAGQTTRIDNLASVTSSYALQSQLQGVASSSAQVKTYLPVSTVSSSGQVDITATTGYATFSSSIATVDATQQVSLNALNAATSSYAINSTIQSQLANVVSSSTQVKVLLPGGTVTSSAQYPGWVTASSQIDYNLIQNKLSGVVSSSTQVKPLLPDGTISSSTQVNAILDADGVFSSSAQVQLASVTGTTFAATDYTFPNNLTVGGTLTAERFITEYISASIIYESGSTKFGDTTDDVMSVTGSIRVLGGSISGSMVGMFSSSAQVDYNSIQNKLSGVVSSSAQIQPLLPAGTVSSSAFTSPSQGTVRLTLNGTALADVDTGLQTGDSPTFSGLTSTGTVLLAGIYSSSGQVDITATTNYTTFSSSIATKNNLQDVSINALNAATSSYAINSTIQSQLAGVISSSAQTVASIANQTIAPTTVNATTINASVVTASALTANQAVFTNASDGLVSNAITGTGNVVMSASPTLTGTLTAANITATGTMLLAGIFSSSAQVDYNNIQNKLSGVVSSSAQVKPLLPVGTVTSSAAGVTQGTISINGAEINVSTLQTTSSPTFAGVTVTGLSANQAVFTNGSDVLTSNAITGTGNVVMSASPTLTGTITADKMVMSGSQFAGIVSGSGLQYRLVVPVGTNYYAT